MRVAIVLRRRVIFSVFPRNGDEAAGAAAAGAPAAGADAAGALAAVSSTSCLRMVPPTPVPVMLSRFTPCCLASLRTIGVT